MNLVRMMDSLLRDRGPLYERMCSGQRLGDTLSQLLILFFVSMAFYGAIMGSFRVFHSQYFFSDFELVSDATPMRGKVAGLNAAEHKVYGEHLAECSKAETVRFNLTHPSEAMKIVAVSHDKGYLEMTLAPDVPLQEPDAWQIPLMVAIKAPLIFILTLLICAPALYVLNLAFSIRLHFLPVMTLCALGLAATGTLLAVLAPVAGLFSVVTESYHFMKVFHLVAFAVTGFYGVKLLREGLLRLASQGKGVSGLLSAWLLLYCLVGSQIAWLLKPFLGTPYLPATPPFRIESGNIYVSAFESLAKMFISPGQ